jgi:hypothetical protein
MGVARRRPHLYNPGGVAREMDLSAWFEALRERLRRVRVVCGDWSRVTSPTVTTLNGVTGVFLDPPYAMEERDRCYSTDSETAAAECARWALERGTDPLLRIALCGYEGAGDDLLAAGWTEYTWRPHGGYAYLGQGRGRVNKNRERIWFSPHCLRQGTLFDPELAPPTGP